MNYIRIIVQSTEETLREILIANLSTIGFDGFEETENELHAFIDEHSFNENELLLILKKMKCSYQKQIIKKQNWNKVWESNFDAVVVDDFVGIRAEFHQPIVGVEHEILITPKMSFGTGHHATTFMMMQLMRTLNFYQKNILDFGTGTGILAILAEKLGAQKVTAIDNDDWCIENASENIIKNNCTQIKIIKNYFLNNENNFAIILANINKNIIEENINLINQSTNKNGDILLSGLLLSDEPAMETLAASFGWQHIKTINKGSWIALHFKKVNF